MKKKLTNLQTFENAYLCSCSNSRKGIYLIHITLDNGLQETHRILKY